MNGRSAFLLSFLLILPGLSLGKAALPDDSIYNVTSEWSLQDGKRVRLDSFGGRPVLISMAYTGCEYTCPLIVEKLKAIQAGIEKKGGKDFRIILASFDSEKDRPERLSAFMKQRKMTDRRWSMAVADTPAATRELAILLGINYKPEEGGHFSHSNVIVLLDSRGRILQQLNGLNADHEDLVRQAVEASHGKP